MASIQDMVKKAAQDVNTGDSKVEETTEMPGGIPIERQNIEHVKGQAKSGLAA